MKNGPTLASMTVFVNGLIGLIITVVMEAVLLAPNGVVRLICYLEDGNNCRSKLLR